MIKFGENAAVANKVPDRKEAEAWKIKTKNSPSTLISTTFS